MGNRRRDFLRLVAHPIQPRFRQIERSGPKFSSLSAGYAGKREQIQGMGKEKRMESSDNSVS